MKSNIIKKFTVSVVEIVDINNNLQYNAYYNVERFARGEKCNVIDVYKINNRVFFILPEIDYIVATELMIQKLYSRFGMIQSINSGIPAAIFKIVGENTEKYTLFVDSDLT